MPEQSDGPNGPWRLPCGHDVLDLNQVHYCSYTNLPAIIGLERPFSGTDRVRAFLHPDEHQFLAVHQMFERAFMVHLFELERVIAQVRVGDYDGARLLLNRVIRWTQFYPQLHGLLFTMRPEDFRSFRAHLAPASGAESIAFRKIEIRSGIRPGDQYVVERGAGYTYRGFLDRPPGFEKNDPHTRWWTDELDALTREVSLRTAFEQALEAAGLSVLQLTTLFTARDHKPLSLLANKLHKYDRAFVEYRRRMARRASPEAPVSGHAQLAETFVGSDPGTGHTTGVPYLTSVTEHARFFPELWEYKEHEADRALPTPRQ